MHHRDMRRLLQIGTRTAEGDESWLTSYLDVFTLLLTLFILLLALAPKEGGERQASSAASFESASAGVRPAHQGLQPRFAGLSIPGVSVLEGREGVTLRIDDSLLFGSGEATLTAQGRQVVASLVEELEKMGGDISVEGHTDDVPIATARFRSNWELSAARAIAVLNHLQRRGIDGDRLRAVGYASSRPARSNDTAEGRAANRRVEILIRQPVGPAGIERP